MPPPAVLAVFWLKASWLEGSIGVPLKGSIRVALKGSCKGIYRVLGFRLMIYKSCMTLMALDSGIIPHYMGDAGFIPSNVVQQTA